MPLFDQFKTTFYLPFFGAGLFIVSTVVVLGRFMAVLTGIKWPVFASRPILVVELFLDMVCSVEFKNLRNNTENGPFCSYKSTNFLCKYPKTFCIFVPLNQQYLAPQIVNFKINLPLPLCEFAIRNNFSSPLRLYIFLKTVCGGQIQLDPATKCQIAKMLGVGPKTINNLIGRLQERNWVGHNPASGYYFIRGFDKIRELEKLRGRRGVWVDVSKDINDKLRFKALVVGAIIGQLANVSRYKLREREARKSEHIKGSSNHNLRNTAPSFFPVACKALSTILNISISTASLYKEMAAKHGFIQVEKKWQRLPLTQDPKERDAVFAASYKASHPEVAHRVRIKDGKVFIQEADQVRACLNYTKKWRPRSPHHFSHN